jgi:hypothetical protein
MRVDKKRREAKAKEENGRREMEAMAVLERVAREASIYRKTSHPHMREMWVITVRHTTPPS